MLKYFARLVLKILGFKIEGQYPYEHKKVIFAVVPHTSNWDFPLGILVKWALSARINFIAKSSLFKWPYGWFFKYMGGIPVDRSKSQNTVQAVAEAYNREERLAIAIAPEGTRSKVDRLKRGFYFIAKLAEIPIVLVRFDYSKKTIHFDDPFFTTDDEEADWKYIHSYFEGVKGKRAEKSFSQN
jgi:1-acyl-sn-glycerol-3-phosphate acyltransferase